ncbi:hypothetical protein [Thauera sedimentorum]|uniref:hypothetical protein n=1 Tax=Thauera sedimentorum TaxID=2767595 RepID=UPI001CDC5552|nr:hypothetical protein [Thauera sedimentorum]
MLGKELDAEKLLPFHRIDHELEARAAELLQHTFAALQVARLLGGERLCGRRRCAAAAGEQHACGSGE